MNLSNDLPILPMLGLAWSLIRSQYSAPIWSRLRFLMESVRMAPSFVQDRVDNLLISSSRFARLFLST